MKLKLKVRAKYLARNSGNWLKENLKEHLSNSTAMIALSTPLFAASETMGSGMENPVSIKSRLIIAGLTYFGGLGYMYGKGRQLSRKIFNITKETKEIYQHIHDLPYTGLFNLVTSPPIYYLMGARDFEQIGIGSLFAAGIGMLGGSIMGWVVDTYGDLTGLRECERKGYPELIKKQPSYIKKTIAAGFVAASLALTSGIYQINNYIREPESKPVVQQVEQVQPSAQSLEQKLENPK